MRGGQASITAQRVAAHRLTFERAPFAGGDPAADDRLARDVAGSVATNEGPMRNYLAARTRFFDRVVVGSIERGMTQFVIAAAGYDGRAWRFAKPGVRFFELDHPSTQADKVARVERLGLATDHVKFVAADFAATDVASSLRAAGLDPSSPAVFTLEGVAIYLEKPVLASVLAALASLAAPASRLAISLSINGRGLSSSVAFRHAVARIGEPVKTVLEPEEVDGFLAAAGWVPTGLGRGGLIILEPAP